MSDEERQYLLADKRMSMTSNNGSSKEIEIKVSDGVGYLEKRRRLKLLKKFYDEQNRLLELYRDDRQKMECTDAVERHDMVKTEKDKSLKWDRTLAGTVFILNIIILGGNLTASILSGSYSVISAFVDSMMDIMSSVVVYTSIWLINNTNTFNYPRGREKLEIIAVIACSIFMGVGNIMMIVQSVEAIIMNNVNPDANLPTMLIMLSSISIKVVVMIVCYKHGTTNSRVLALDQRNDIITSIVALGGAYIGNHYWLYADPVGAILVCTFIATSWFWNAMDHVPLMVGHRAEQEEVSRILSIALNHDDRIKCLDHVMVYHVGEKALVELHVVLDEHLPLKLTHDICEGLQDKINGLPFVERTFIHVDYFCDGSHDGK